VEFEYRGESASGGVYKITNIQNGRLYIGSAKRFSVRGIEHRRSLDRGKHQNKFLQNDFNKCGTDAFRFEVLEVVVGEREDRLLREDHFLAKHFDNQHTCYNLRPKATAPQSKPVSSETAKKKRTQMMKRRWADPDYRVRMSVRHKELVANGEAKPPSMSGKTHSTETKQKIGKAHCNKIVTKGTRKRISAAAKEVWKRPGYKERMSQAHRKP